jgi:hypothetical protein
LSVAWITKNKADREKTRMTTISLVNGRDRVQQAVAAGSLSWRALKERVQNHLELQGMPLPQAERYSHDIVVLCAHEADGSGPAQMDQRALSEAQNILESWHAARRVGLSQAA